MWHVGVSSLVDAVKPNGRRLKPERYVFIRFLPADLPTPIAGETRTKQRNSFATNSTIRPATRTRTRSSIKRAIAFPYLSLTSHNQAYQRALEGKPQERKAPKASASQQQALRLGRPAKHPKRQHMPWRTVRSRTGAGNTATFLSTGSLGPSASSPNKTPYTQQQRPSRTTKHTVNSTITGGGKRVDQSHTPPPVTGTQTRRAETASNLHTSSRRVVTHR